MIKFHTFNSQENFIVQSCVYTLDFYHLNTEICLSHCIYTFLVMLSFETSASRFVLKKCFPYWFLWTPFNGVLIKVAVFWKSIPQNLRTLFKTCEMLNVPNEFQYWFSFQNENHCIKIRRLIIINKKWLIHCKSHEIISISTQNIRASQFSILEHLPVR